MDMVPNERPPEGLTPAERADAILAQLPERDLDALFRAIARALISAAENREAAARGEQPPTTPPPPPKQPTRRPSPRRLAKWEAQWQAEHDGAEGDR